MVIYIDVTIREHCEQFGLNNDEKLLFLDLANAHQKGNCFLCGDLKSAEWLAENIEGTYGAIYKDIYDKYTNLRSIVELVETVIVISYKENPILPIFFSGKSRVLKIGDAIGNAFETPCVLLAENLNDCRFYELIAKRYIYDKKRKGVDISFCHTLGGGDTINAVFKKCVEEDKVLTLCIVDSDKKYGATGKFPEPPAKGQTALHLETAYTELKERIKTPTFELYCLPIHEVENLIPLCILEMLASDVPTMRDGLGCLHKLVSLDLREAVLCYDFKKGGKKTISEPAQEYWGKVLSEIGEDEQPALCEKILAKALVVLSDENQDSKCGIASVVIDDYLVDLWNEIGKKAFSWGCANTPIRA